MGGELYILTADQIVTATGLSRRTFWRHFKDVPRLREGSARVPHRWALHDTVTALRGRKGGLPSGGEMALARSCSPGAMLAPAALYVGDVTAFRDCLEAGSERIKAAHFVAKAKTNLFSKMGAQADERYFRSCESVIAHPQICRALFGCPESVPPDKDWPDFISAFATANLPNKEIDYVQ